MFDKDYMVFDEFGLKEIRCMSCGNTIKSRQEIMSAQFPGKVIREISKHPEYKEIAVVLSDGNLAFIMVCDNCKFIEIGEEEAKKITQQISNALRSQLSWEGKTDDLIDEIIKNQPRQVIRKADVGEVTRALRGV